MDYQRKSNGWQTFLEHWVFMLPLVLGLGISTLLTFFTRLTGTPWIWLYTVALLAGALSVGLLLYAKLPLYRQRRYFTFGPRALPEQRRKFYRWAYACVEPPHKIEQNRTISNLVRLALRCTNQLRRCLCPSFDFFGRPSAGGRSPFDPPIVCRGTALFAPWAPENEYKMSTF